MGKTHIITLIIIAAMYAFVGIWKYGALIFEQEHQHDMQTASDREEILQFWTAYNKATTYRSQRDYYQAASYYAKALEINDSHEDALYYMASMHLLLKNFEETEKFLLKLEKKQPNTPRAHLQLGVLYSCMDSSNTLFNLQESKNRFDSAWRLNREETGTPLKLSKIYLLQNETEAVKPLLDVVITANKMSYQAMFLDGYVYWKNGNEQQAMGIFNSAMNLYQSLEYTEIQGEGATQAGSRAMLSEDRYCDGFESHIQSLLSGQITITGYTVYEMFDEQLSAWRLEYL
jgi:tetratricopeptide (TPR) repeat protein